MTAVTVGRFEVEPEWRVTCLRCGQTTITSQRPAADRQCERCALADAMGLVPGQTVGLRVHLVTLSHDPERDGDIGEAPRRPLVNVGGRARAISVQLHDLGLWQSVGEFAPNYINEVRP